MLDWLQGWYNWPFLLSLLVGLGLAGVALLGMGKDAEAHVHVVDGAGHLDAHAHVEPGHVDLRGLGWLGFGKAPLSILLQTLLVTFGLVGLLVNAIATDAVGWFGRFAFPVALVGAVAAAIAATRGVAALFERYMPPERATGKAPGFYVGKLAKAASLVTPDFGQVLVEEAGDVALLNACAEAGDIPRGVEVQVVGYDAAKHIYRVTPVTPEA